MRVFAGRGLWLVAVWLLLWEEVSAANVLSGVAVAAGTLVLFPPRAAKRQGTFRPIPALKFLVYFHIKLFQASAIVAWEIVTPRSRINQGIVAVPIRHVSDALTTLIANAISLTPGTLTIEVHRNPTVLYVHVLHLRDVEAIRRDVRQLELYAARAFGSQEAIRAAAAEKASLENDSAGEQRDGEGGAGP